MSDDAKILHLEPARPDTGDDLKSFRPRMPWKWIAPFVAIVLTIFGYEYWKDVREMARMRGKIVATHERGLAPVRTRIDALRTKIEDLALAELAREPERLVDERLNVDALHRGHGLYLRVNAAQVRDRQTLSNAAKTLVPDVIGDCLGISPASARGFYEYGEFLSDGWRSEVDAADSVLRLRVLEDELNRRIDRDLPALTTLLESEWFMLAVERGASRADGPVDVYLWDLRTNTKLLALRTRAEGSLIMAQAQFGDAPSGPRAAAPGPTAATSANDCSIASQVRAAAAH